MALNNVPGVQFEPSAIKKPTQENYIDIFDYTSQYKPDAYEELISIYGDQSLTGILFEMGNEEAISSDQYIWTEKGRLHTSYTDVARSGNVFTKADHVYRVGEVVACSGNGSFQLGRISAVTATTFTALPYKAAGWLVGTTAIKTFISHSEFQKGTGGMDGSLETDFTVLNNKTIIFKDNYVASGSDITQDSWVKTDNGGFVWYLQSELDGRRRFEDRIEMGLLLGEDAEAGSGAGSAGYDGSEGMFESIRDRGNIFDGLATTLADWDSILKRFDQQGKIREYMFFVDRDQSLAIDDLLGTLNAGYSGGISYGMFDNDEEMAVNLGFTGFRRGTYNFYKSDWKLLNDPQLLGAVAPADGKVRGLLVPHGEKEVYDGSSSMADRVTRPYLSIKYRVKGNENRRHKTWVTGSVGTTPTDDNDHMRVNHLADRGVCTIGAANYMLFEGA